MLKIVDFSKLSPPRPRICAPLTTPPRLTAGGSL